MRIVSAQTIVNKRVLVRLDLDVPIGADGIVAETTRVVAAAQTMELLAQNARQVIYCGHMGRPHGKPEPALSLRTLLPLLAEQQGHAVTFEDLYLAQEHPKELTAKFILLENLRFFTGEEENDPTFAKRLANVADIFINEAFGVAHRSAASTVGVAKLLPSYTGLHFAREVVELSTILHNPIKPFVVVLGGAKLETKLPVIEQLKDTAEAILVGGLLARELHEHAKSVPANVVVADLAAHDMDISEASRERFATILSKAQTIVWNGPLGKFEETDKILGTKAVAEAIINSGAYSVVGGGDTLAALGQLGLLESFDFVSVGGGAMMEFLSGQPLPAVEVLEGK